MAVRWKCPICKKETEPLIAQFPFCSERCRDLDLANWATEKYVISSPVRPREQGDFAPPQEPDEDDA